MSHENLSASSTRATVLRLCPFVNSLTGKGKSLNSEITLQESSRLDQELFDVLGHDWVAKILMPLSISLNNMLPLNRNFDDSLPEVMISLVASLVEAGFDIAAKANGGGYDTYDAIHLLSPDITHDYFNSNFFDMEQIPSAEILMKIVNPVVENNMQIGAYYYNAFGKPKNV